MRTYLLIISIVLIFVLPFSFTAADVSTNEPPLVSSQEGTLVGDTAGMDEDDELDYSVFQEVWNYIWGIDGSSRRSTSYSYNNSYAEPDLSAIAGDLDLQSPTLVQNDVIGEGTVDDVDVINNPAPSALLLSSMGAGIVGWLRRRKSI